MKQSPEQFNALHLWCERLAEALNDAGYETRAVLEQKHADVPWNKELVKELLWRPIQKTMTGKDSTTKLNRAEPGDIYEVLNRHLAEKFGVSVPWPTGEDND